MVAMTTFGRGAFSRYGRRELDALGIRMDRTETAGRLRAKQLQIVLKKYRMKQLQMG